jgi:putative membrane protein
MSSEKMQWFQTAFQIKGSVLKAIYQRVILCGMFGLFISILY